MAIRADISNVMGRIRGHRSWEGLIALVLLWVLDNVTGNWVTESVLPWALKVGKQLAARPVGIFGLLAFFLFALVLLSVAFENSKVASALIARIRGKPERTIRQPDAPKPLSIEEQTQIQAMRTFWKRYAEDLANALIQFSAEVFYEVREKHYANKLLVGEKDKLAVAIAAVEQALKADASIGEACLALRVFDARYRDVYWLLLQIHKNDLVLTEGHYGVQLQACQQAHQTYVDKLEDLSTQPGLEGSAIPTWRNTVNTEFKPRPSSLPSGPSTEATLLPKVSS